MATVEIKDEWLNALIEANAPHDSLTLADGIDVICPQFETGVSLQEVMRTKEDYLAARNGKKYKCVTLNVTLVAPIFIWED